MRDKSKHLFLFFVRGLDLCSRRVVRVVAIVVEIVVEIVAAIVVRIPCLWEKLQRASSSRVFASSLTSQ